MTHCAHAFAGRLLVGLTLSTSLSAAQKSQAFEGTISDDMCWKAGHERMQMGPTDAECVKACIEAHGASYVLVVKSDVYTLSDAKAAERFAGQKVKVNGVLDSKTKAIHVASIAASKDK